MRRVLKSMRFWGGLLLNIGTSGYLVGRLHCITSHGRIDSR